MIIFVSVFIYFLINSTSCSFFIPPFKFSYKIHPTILFSFIAHNRLYVVRDELLKKNNKILFCVRYNPQTNPIEEFFSQIKHYVRKSSPLNYTEIYKTLEKIFKIKVKKSHLQNYFKHVLMKTEK